MNNESVYTRIFGRRAFIQGLAAGAAGVAAIPSFKPKMVRAQTAENGKSRVHLLRSKDLRQTAYDVLKPFQEQVKNSIGDKNVVLKVNCGMAHPQYKECSTQADSVRGILDLIREVYDGPVTISEGTAGAMCDMFIGYENYDYLALEQEYKDVKLVDANLQPYEQHFIHTWDYRPFPINLCSLYTDPNTYLISASRMKSHNALVATLSFKNVAMGAPIVHWNREDLSRSARNEKSRMHGLNAPRSVGASGQQLSYNVFRVALAGVQPDLAFIDGSITIEGDGPWDGGVIVEHGIALGSNDFVACDRIGTELMEIDPEWMKYLEWCAMAGMGNWERENIEVTGEKVSDLSRKYVLHQNVEQQVQWIYDVYGI